MHNPALQALQGAGSELEGVSEKLLAQANARNREAAFADLESKAAWAIAEKKQQLLTSPEFYADPANTANTWKPWTDDFLKQSLEGVKDPNVRTLFSKHFSMEAARHWESIQNAAMHQSQQVDGAKYMQAINRYETMAGADNNLKDSVDSLDKAEALYNRMEAQGLIKPEEKEKKVTSMREKFAHSRIQNIAMNDPDQAKAILEDQRGIGGWVPAESRTHLASYIETRQNNIKTHSETEQAKAEERQLKAENDKTFLQVSGSLKDKPPDDPAWEDLRNHIQSDPASFGLNVHPSEQAMKISGDLETMRKQRKQSADDGKKAAGDELMNNVLTKDVSVNDINTFKNKKGVEPDAKSKESAIRWINSDEAKRNQTDPELYGRLVSDIGAHRITDPEELNQHLANGIGKADYHQLRNMVEAERDPEKSPSLKYAKEAFFAKYSVSGVLPDDVTRLYPRFITQYEQQVRGQQLKGDKTHELADKMLSDTDKAIIGGWGVNKGTVFGYTKQPALDFARSWGSWPEPDLTPEPTATPANIPRSDPLGIR